MGLRLVTRCDDTWPTGLSASLLGAVAGVITNAPAGSSSPASSGAGLGFTPLGTGPLGG